MPLLRQAAVSSDDILELDVFVRLEVARSRFADPADLTSMAETPDADTHCSLAEFGVLPAGAVLALARDPDREVRTMLVRNRRLAPAVADLRTALLLDDPSAGVRSELLELDLSVALRTRVLAGLREHEVRHPQPWMREDLLRRIISSAGDDADLRGAAVWCLPADSELLRSWSSADDPSLRWDAASSPVLPDDLRRRLAGDADAHVRRAAIDPSLQVDLLVRLSQDPDAGVRAEAVQTCRQVAVAGTRSAPELAAVEQALRRAAHDRDDHVRAEAARHHPVHPLVHDDPSAEVRCSLARTSRDPDTLRRLAEDPEPDVVDDVAANPHAPPGLLTRMCARTAAQWAQSSGLADGEEPREGYARFRAMREAGSLALLVAHPALPDAVAAGLLAHRSPTVADAALARLGHDPDVVPVRALRLRHRRGLLWQLLARAGAPVRDPAVREAVLELLPSEVGSVSDLATRVRGRR